MKSNLACLLCGIAVAVAVAGGPAVAQTAEPSDGPTHVPMQPYRNSDGSLKYGFRGTITTQSWAGYAVTAGAPYTSASATWQVPSVTYDGGSTPYGYEYVLNWVGIGGYGDSTLIQLGSESYVSTSGAASHQVWYELYPAVTQAIPYTVKAGDIITASLQCTTACSPAQVQTWQLTMTDETAGWTWTQNFQYQSSMASAEWITEPPYYNTGFLPLADYVKVTYDPVFANGVNPNLTLAANGIQMSGAWGQTSNPSDPVGGNIFSTCWGTAPSYTACTAGSFTTPPPATTASLSASPTKISPGQGSTLSWSATNASSCRGGGFAASGTSGSAVVLPSVTTAYSVTCTGNGGSATALATVTVSSPKTCQKKHC
jgi:hypothetical protein